MLRLKSSLEWWLIETMVLKIKSCVSWRCWGCCLRNGRERDL